MNAIKEMFRSKKPVIGMLHLDYLAGNKFKGINYVVTNAIQDVKALEIGGISGILIENWKEESIGEFVSKETQKNLTEVIQKLSKKIHVPFGVNVLNNDYKVAFSIAKLTSASFVQLDVFVDNVKSNFENNENAIVNPFTINPKPRDIWRFAKSVGAESIPLFVFVQPKHYLMLDKDKAIEKSTKQAVKAGASSLLVTKATGFTPAINLIKRVKKVAGKIPVGIGSGFSADNAKMFLPYIDFAIVGSSLKKDGVTDNPVDIKRVSELIKTVSGVK